mmetsp:Transcript_12911/g.42230  ORF Transcript_12911/g.42230 Transcript_12911/m.42230 type:complete len:259 (+) Transcript_12911:136-912(+)
MATQATHPHQQLQLRCTQCNMASTQHEHKRIGCRSPRWFPAELALGPSFPPCSLSACLPALLTTTGRWYCDSVAGSHRIHIEVQSQPIQWAGAEYGTRGALRIIARYLVHTASPSLLQTKAPHHYHQSATRAALRIMSTEERMMLSAWKRSPRLLRGSVRVACAWGGLCADVGAVCAGPCAPCAPCVLGASAVRPSDVAPGVVFGHADSTPLGPPASDAPTSVSSKERTAGDGSRAQSATARNRPGKGLRHSTVRPAS